MQGRNLLRPKCSSGLFEDLAPMYIGVGALMPVIASETKQSLKVYQENPRKINEIKNGRCPYFILF